MDLPVLSTNARPAQNILDAAREVLDVDPARTIELASVLSEAGGAGAARAGLLIGAATYAQGGLKEALPILLAAKEGLLRAGDTPHALEATLALGRLHRDLGEFKGATKQFEEALELARRANDPQTEVDALNLQAGVLSAQGEHPRALEVLGRALELARTLELWERQANILNNLGTLHITLGDYPLALENLKTAYELFQNLVPGTRSGAMNLISLGHIYQEMGNRLEARVFYVRAREASHNAQDLLMEAVALNSLANVDLSAGDWASSRENFEEALNISQRVGARQYEIDNLDGLGQLYVALEDFDRAAHMHLTALAVAREIGDPEGETDALLNLGKDYSAINRADEALDYLKEGLSLAQGLGHQPSVFEAHKLLSQAFKHTGDFEGALHHYEAFHEVEKSIFNEENERQTRKLTVQFEVERARHEAEESRLRTEVMKSARDEAEAMVRERTRELEEAQLEIVTRLAVAAEYRDDDTGEHTRRVGHNAAAMARVLGWGEDETQLLFTAARLHDVGKIGVRDAILHKPGKLDADEMALMRTHTTIGARILSGGHSPLLRLAEEIALAHHERWDGAGYPLGLAGEAIPEAARIVAVADVLDALTHARPYKRAWSLEEALAEIGRGSGRHFDPRVVEACFKAFGRGGEHAPDEAAPDGRETARASQPPSERGAAPDVRGELEPQHQL